MLQALKKELEKYDISPRKERGQNFLFHTPTLEHIAQQCLPGENILEIGPGPGTLTAHLSAHQQSCCVVIEKDARFLPLLTEKLPATAQIFIEDALTFSWDHHQAPPVTVLGNLPYNVSVPILFRYLQLGPAFPKAIFMFQKEVAQRLTAAPQTPSYGRLSVMAQHVTHITELFSVPRQYFWPAPTVDSVVVAFHRHPCTFPPHFFSLMEDLVFCSFQHRRKMLRKNLLAFAHKHRIPHIDDWLLRHNIAPTSRAEDISVEDFCALAQSVVP